MTKTSNKTVISTSMQGEISPIVEMIGKDQIEASPTF